jgi:molecular chaperone DnaJ
LPDHYRALGLAETATAEEIKRAYRRLARDCHPDRRGDDPTAADRFKEISQAHWALSDTARRAEYDRLRRDPLAKPKGAAARSQHGKPSAAQRAGAAAATLFQSLFGQGRTGASAGPGGGDLSATIRIPFLIGIRGGTQALTIKRETTCDRCHGNAAEPNTPIATCPTCKGRGDVTVDQGSFGVTRVCHHCRGRGTLPRVACRRCHGAGVLARERAISVRIPPGIETGTRLRITGEGDPGVDGKPAGDLYVTVQIDDHPEWQRRGDDIHSDLTLDISQVVLGGTVAVETVDGTVQLKVPPGTQPETTFRLQGRGVVRGGGSTNGNSGGDSERGDHFVHAHLAIPSPLDADARKQFLKFARTAGLKTDK